MTENIELYSYPSRKEQQEDIQVYHEIKQEALTETAEPTSSKLIITESINSYEFFTIQEPKPTHKKGEKKKKGKKKEKSLNLMDMVNSELASMSVPITGNVIEIVENRNNYFRDYFNCFASDFRTIQRKQSYFDLKRRFQSSQTIHMSPVFPDELLAMSAIETQESFPVEYIGPAPFDDVLAEYNITDDEHSTKFLDVELKNIKFKHHHKFSLESLLYVKLIEQFDEYENLHQTLKELSRDIKVSRETKNNLKKDLIKVSPSKKDELRFDATVRKYAGQLLNLKDKYRETFKEHKLCTHKILSLWSDIEMIRDKFQCKDTLYDLYIKKYSISLDEFEKEWNDLYEAEFTDMLDKLEYEYVGKYIEYREAKIDHSLENGSNKKRSKPRMNVNEEELKAEVERLVNSVILREKIDLSLVKAEESISESNKIRNVYHFEVYVDKTFVCASEDYKSDDKILGVNFIESFSVEILPINKNLIIVLFENNKEVANVQLNISKVKNINVSNDFAAIEFQYHNDEGSTTKCVGSGYSIKEIAAANKVRLKSSNIFKGNLTTTCEVLIRIGFRETMDQMEATKSSMEVGKKLQRLLHGIDKPDINVLTYIIGQIYDKDVRSDENITHTINRLCNMNISQSADYTFPIEENSPEHVRLKLLHLRNSGGFTHVENKMVPIHGSQISTEQLNCLQNTKAKDIDIDYLKSKESDMDRIELQRFIAAKYIKKLNNNVIKSLNDHLMVKTHKDVVREYQNFSLRSLFSKEGSAPCLAPISSNTKQQILADSLNKDQEIQMTVVRAFNLLDRSNAMMEDSENDIDTIAGSAEPVSGFQVRPLRPYVKISYHGASAQTVTAMGCHPTWNHTLKFSTKLNPLSTLQINIFDEYKDNISEGEGTEDQSNRTVHYRYSSKWLGTAQVPLFTVLSLGTLRGTFKISAPPLLIGYETLQNKESSSLMPEVTQLMKKVTSFITLHITTSLSHLGGFQMYNQPSPSSTEDNYIIKYLNTFVTDYINDFPNRNISLTFIDSAGRNKCVSQFLQPIPMPSREYFPKNPKNCSSALSKSSGYSRSSSSKSSGRKREVDLEANGDKESVYSQGSWKGGDDLGKMINSCLRYVSLIPSYDVTETHAVTLMGLELLKVLYGTPLDHSILLASYFLYLGIRSWIAIGLGLPRGRSSYVIIQYDLAARRYVLTSDVIRSRGFLRTDGYMWIVCDASSGERSDVRDVACPMKTVDCVFDSENIWVNIQSSQDCENVLFDFSKPSDWQPVFDKSFFVMKHPLVNDSNVYTPPGRVESLRQALEAKIKGKVQKWRPHMKTIWNRYCSGLLRDALLYWEYWSFSSNENKPGFSQKFKQLMVTYRMFGFPLNLPFISTKCVISAVKSTGVQLNDDPDAEFALAVEVKKFSLPTLTVNFQDYQISIWILSENSLPVY
ncbi:putative coiled-coil and C2 domain containing 2A [Operophtera brumata]|uniref:Putative coiled-coil and C2 domain containing 2A n=1 Tax=Operophtera brumata TaxID=104452 RepID=A0A0L7L6B7_OPEBR|nr:putative coiled-coil and C2 domain containing 2A [Operophtera brumata]